MWGRNANTQKCVTEQSAGEPWEAWAGEPQAQVSLGYTVKPSLKTTMKSINYEDKYVQKSHVFAVSLILHCHFVKDLFIQCIRGYFDCMHGCAPYVCLVLTGARTRISDAMELE